MARYIKYLTLFNCLNVTNQKKQIGSYSSIRLLLQFCQVRAFISSRTKCFHTSITAFKRRQAAEEKKAPKVIEYKPQPKWEVVDIWKGITLKEIASVLNKDFAYVQKLFMNEIKYPNFPVNDTAILQNALKRAGKRMRLIAKPTDQAEEKIVKDIAARPPPTKEMLRPRPPVVTVMGHVDHGKTTLLDALRHSSVVDQEFGGITQHIGAFSVVLDSGSRITFLDTPGHAAFTSMRARGANVTDIVVLVVAADDGVMEQTIESINMAQRAKVPILVAINKIDAPKANVERAEKMLLEQGIQVERLGGDTQAVPISALKRQNLDKLTEALILQAELLEVGGDPTGPVEAVVVESIVHHQRGKLCTAVIQRGTLKRGNILVAGTAFARVRLLRDASGQVLQSVTPGNPVEIEGWRDLPPAGELILEVENEGLAKDVIKFREKLLEQKKLEEDEKIIKQKREEHDLAYREQLEKKRKLGRRRLKREGPRQPEFIKENGPPSLNIIVKSDVDGTLEAILEILDTYESDECKLDIVHYGVGAISQNELELAQTFNCIIYAFNVDINDNIKNLGKELDIEIRHFNVIYKLIDDFKREINSRLPEKEVEEVVGKAEVLQQIEINERRKKVPIAGCICIEGILKKSARFRAAFFHATPKG
ncbi:translation initiation factor IF-2, mitochondrial isoform X2 [Cylas formicarius]|uniref:translation initiation factor IF-2, mitochondrial isoform X2 n=1 Tax=Cylas formicarius TaxID=197179 RepID=UPI00295857FB|nr:translation initiation factor IF-2, mitochondrial isoform X2 [Cylas formicarius]